MFSSYIRIKIIAVLIGVSGIGIFGQFQNLYSLLIFVSPLGLSQGITKIIAEKRSNPSFNLSYFISDLLKILLSSGLILSPFFIIFSDELSSFLVNDSQYYYFSYIFVVFLFIINLFTLFDSVIKGIERLNLYSKIIIISSLISLIISIPLIYLFGLTGAVISLGLNYLFYFIVSLYFLIRLKLVYLSDIKIFSKFHYLENYKILFLIGISFVVAGFLNQLSFILVRKLTIDYFGYFHAGIIQSIFTISVNYFGILFAVFPTYLFPKYVKVNTPAESNEFINKVLSLIIPLIILSILIIYLFKNPIINILYSNDFMQAASLFKFQLIGELFKSLSWTFALWYIPKAKLNFYLLSEIIFFISFIGIYFIALVYFNVDYNFASISYSFSYFVIFVFNYIIYKRQFKFKAVNNNIFIFLIGISLIIIVIFSVETTIFPLMIISIILVMFWTLFTVSKVKKFNIEN